MFKMACVRRGIRTSALEGVSDRGKQLVRIVRFLKKGDRSKLARRFPQSAQLARGNEDDGRLFEPEARQSLSNRKTNANGHPDVHEDEIRPIVHCSF